MVINDRILAGAHASTGALKARRCRHTGIMGSGIAPGMKIEYIVTDALMYRVEPGLVCEILLLICRFTAG